MKMRRGTKIRLTKKVVGYDKGSIGKITGRNSKDWYEVFFPARVILVNADELEAASAAPKEQP